MRGYYNPFADRQQVRDLVDHDFRFALQYLNEGIEGRSFLRQSFAAIERHDTDAAGGLPDDSLNHDRVGYVFYDFDDDVRGRLFHFRAINLGVVR
jgi:hypothetical protein